MDVDEHNEQERIHEALSELLPVDGALTGWVVAWEGLPADGGAAQAGHFYGPAGMTTWRAIGLLEWCRYSLAPDDEDEDE